MKEKTPARATLSIGDFRLLRKPEPHWDGEASFAGDAVTVSFYGAAPPTEREVARLHAFQTVHRQLSQEILERLVNVLVEQIGLDALAPSPVDDPAQLFELECVSITGDDTFELGYSVDGWDDATCTVCVRDAAIEHVYLAD